jgi:hypothetical protein
MLRKFLNCVIRSAATRIDNQSTRSAKLHSPTSNERPSAPNRESIQIILTQNPRNFFGNERAAARHIQELEHDVTQIVNVITPLFIHFFDCFPLSKKCLFFFF